MIFYFPISVIAIKKPAAAKGYYLATTGEQAFLADYIIPG